MYVEQNENFSSCYLQISNQFSNPQSISSCFEKHIKNDCQSKKPPKLNQVKRFIMHLQLVTKYLTSTPLPFFQSQNYCNLTKYIQIFYLLIQTCSILRGCITHITVIGILLAPRSLVSANFFLIFFLGYLTKSKFLINKNDNARWFISSNAV